MDWRDHLPSCPAYEVLKTNDAHVKAHFVNTPLPEWDQQDGIPDETECEACGGILVQDGCGHYHHSGDEE
jgi:hypothetical protein